jgi:hypothetical protein
MGKNPARAGLDERHGAIEDGPPGGELYLM